jgi:hypothetical protein
MPLVLSGTDGVSGVDGTASNPSLEGTDSNTGVFFPAADTVAIGTGGTERMRIDSAGNGGLGVTPASWSTDYKTLQVGVNSALYGRVTTLAETGVAANAYRNTSGTWTYLSTATATRYEQSSGLHYWYTAPSGTAGNAITFTQAMTLTASGQLELTAAAPRLAIAPSTGTNNAFVHFINSASANFSYVGIDSNGGGLGGQYTMNLWHGANYAMVFGTNNTERARITSGGYFKASNSGAYFNASGEYHEFRSNSGNNLVTYLTHTSATQPYGTAIAFTAATPNNTTNYFLSCDDTTNTKLAIWSSGTVNNRTGTYAAFSDIKLKQDIVDASSQWDDIKALRFRKYRFKDDPNGSLQLGLISQEAELVSPGLVFETPDTSIDEEGNRVETGEVTKSIKYSILYMKAVKALQEAMTRIEQLEAKVAALESA